MTELEKYYNKFNEEKRLTRRHGQVEFITSMKYIHECIGDRKCVKILDIGAGMSLYAIGDLHLGFQSGKSMDYRVIRKYIKDYQDD